MTLKSSLLPLLAFLCALPAQAAVVAVMPVQGVNLTPGQCDALGVLFAGAFARETNVAVASPLETRPLLAQGRSPDDVLAALGAKELVSLHAVLLENRVTLSATRFAKGGSPIFRSDTSAPSLDEAEPAVARLARSLAWRQPLVPTPDAAALPPAVVESEAAPATKDYPKALGLKTGLVFARSGGRSYAPMMSLQFDARFGSRDYFLEVGAGGAIPTSAARAQGDVQMGGVFAELGGSVYLSSGSVAPYLGAGVSPRLWIVDDPVGGEAGGATCAVYGQAGLTLTRDSRARLYTELRISQYVIGLNETQHAYDSSASSPTTLYPTELALQIGVGW